MDEWRVRITDEEQDGQVDPTAVMIATGALAGGTIGVAAGWLVGRRRLRIERWQHERQLEEIRQTATDANALSHSLRRARTRLDEYENLTREREARLRERNRRVTKLRDQILDRESTIDSLRSRLYGARLSISFLEDEIEQLRNSSSRSETAASNSLTIFLGNDLEIETTPSESHASGSN